MPEAESLRRNRQPSLRMRRGALLAPLTLLCAACGGSGPREPGNGLEPAAGGATHRPPPPAGGWQGDATPQPSAGAPPVVVIDPTQSNPDPSDPVAGDCGVSEAEAKLVTQPVDIILVIDNSGSMSEEIIGVERNINVNFANILQAAQIDYRVVLVSRHGSSDRNVICIEAPLSGASSCNPPPMAPVFSERFFQYDTKIDSHDSFVKILGTYRRDPEVKDTYRDYSLVSPSGWHGYVRAGARKVFLELTDDDVEGMSFEEFDRKLLALDPAQFGTESKRNYVWHSIVGMSGKSNPTEAWLPDEPIQQGMCGEVEAPGVQYQELSRMTGGLRFPLCHPESYDTVFKQIASEVISHTEVACDFPIPPPPTGETLDLDKVAVSYTPEPGAPEQRYGQALDLASCQPNAFYIQNQQISLCPETCSILQSNPTALVKVLFTCEPTLLVVK